MEVKVERKFLVNDKEIINQALEAYEITQAYLMLTEDRMLRVDHMVPVKLMEGMETDECYDYMAFKVCVSNATRYEMEDDIDDDEDVEKLMSMRIGNLVQKTRYKVPFTDNTGRQWTWKIDVFKEASQGLFLAEVDVTTENEQIQLPPWIGTEVTHDKRFTNPYLSKDPFKNWEKDYF